MLVPLQRSAPQPGEDGVAFFVSGVQLPGLVPLQVPQTPHVLLPQQTESTQEPVEHWSAAVHAAPPPARATHVAPLQ